MAGARAASVCACEGSVVAPGAGGAGTVCGGSSGRRVRLGGPPLVAVVLVMPAGRRPTREAWLRRRAPVPVEVPAQAGAFGHGPATTRERALEDVAEAVADDHAEGEILLEVRGASKSFGGLGAVDNASLNVRKGSITGLISPHGSGKTTLFNLITGGVASDFGAIVLQGQRLAEMPP
mgnify:CR=1 FL=1